MLISVATLEDDPIVQLFLNRLLSTSDICQHIGAAHNRSEAFQLIERNQADVYLIDLHLVDVTGLELIQHIKKHCSDAACLVLSSINDQRRILEIIQAGANGYLLKDDHPDLLIEKIISTHNGHSQLSLKITNMLLQSVVDGSKENVECSSEEKSPKDNVNSFKMTRREIQILQKLSTSDPVKLIANQLHISQFTVNQHIQHIYRKLGVNNRAMAIIKAYELKII